MNTLKARIDNDIDIISNKINKPFTGMVFSDIHFYSYENQASLLKMLEDLALIYRPDSIFIPGDIFDTVDVLNDPNQANYLINWLKKISKISKVFIVMGNHDIQFGKGFNWTSKEELGVRKFNQYFKNTIDNVYLLMNESYTNTEAGISVTGFNLDARFYRGKHNSDMNYFAYLFNNFISKLDLSNNTFNILLMHTNSLIDKGNIISSSLIPNIPFQLVLSGHNHGGVIGRDLAKFLELILPDYISRQHRGLIGPHFSFKTMEPLFPSDSYGIVYQDNKIFLNSRGVTKFTDSTGIFKLLNNLYKVDVDIIKFNNIIDEIDINDQVSYLKEKPYIKTL